MTIYYSTHCPQSDVPGDLHDTVDRIIGSLIKQLSSYKCKRSKDRLFRYYQALPINLRSDIGLADPQIQIKILDRYVSNEIKFEDWKISCAWPRR
ncbi:MAG: hypothetical protein ACI8P9_000234 [Parasphingorhabdus sp.]|jgi:hypothetical protein